MGQNLVGNTKLTKRAFKALLEKRTDQQLQNKINLGQMTIQALESDPDERAPATIKSLRQQIAIIEEVLRERSESEEVPAGPGEEQAAEGPKDVVIGMKSLELSGKIGLGQ